MAQMAVLFLFFVPLFTILSIKIRKNKQAFRESRPLVEVFRELEGEEIDEE